MLLLFGSFVHMSLLLIAHAGKTLVDAKITEIEKDKLEGVEPAGFLSNVIASGQQSPGEIVTTVSELLTAAVDTVR